MTREQWLLLAVDALRPVFRELAGAEIPEHVQVSVGWSAGRSMRSVLGTCHSASASEGAASIFIAPTLADPEQVLGTLVHELAHAADDCQHGHGPEFRRIATAVGLTGPMTATTVGPDLHERLGPIIDALGPYPHKALIVGQPGKGKGRMVKVECVDGTQCDNYSFYTTQKWIDAYVLRCPICGELATVRGIRPGHAHEGTATPTHLPQETRNHGL